MGVKGAILAAGYGTRFLPVTRSVPKEMLPLVDRPALDFIIQEFMDAGIEEVLLISSRRKGSMEAWFHPDEELDHVLLRDGKAEAYAKARPPNIRVQIVHQKQMRGTGDALMLVNLLEMRPLLWHFLMTCLARRTVHNNSLKPGEPRANPC